jgi:hypothetical protein
VLFLRGLLWRRGFTAAVLMVATISAAVAAIGPLYARAASESTLTDELRAAGARAGLSFNFIGLAGHPGAAAADGDLARRNTAAGFAPPLEARSVVITAKAMTDRGPTNSTMAFRSGQCGEVTFVSGRCPAAVGEAMVPANALATVPNWRVGANLTLHQSINTNQGIVEGAEYGVVRIVGVYRAHDTSAPFWFGRQLFSSQYGPGVSSGLRLGVDAVFVTRGQFDRMPDSMPYQLGEDLPLVPEQIRLADLPRLHLLLSSLRASYPSDAVTSGRPGLNTDLAAVLDDAARDKRQVQNATLVVVLELAALSLLVLFQVVGGAVEARGDEIALAKLRGLRPARTVAFALREPITLLLLAAPLGLLLAYAVTGALSRAALVAGSPVRFTTPTGWALAAAFGGSAVAAILAAARTVTRPVLEQWRNTSPKQHGKRLLFALDIGFAVVAVASAIALRAGSADRPRAVFLLTPALIVSAVALLGVRALPRLGRLGLPRTRASRHVAMFLALRQTVRRPGGLRLAALLAVAAGLATFAVCGEAVAKSNRAARAQTEIGTAQQVAVQFDAGHDPQTIVDAVDPGGRWAMATATWVPDGSVVVGPTIIGPLLGVEPARLSATSYSVRGEQSAASLASAITSGVSIPARFTGTRLRARITSPGIVGDHSVVELDYRRAHSTPAAIPAGPLLTGTHDYTVTVDCPDECDFTGVTIDRTIHAAPLVRGSLTLEGVSVGGPAGFRPLDVRLTDARAWRADELGFTSAQQITVSSRGVTTRFEATNGASPILAYNDAPLEIPIAATPKSASESSAAGSLADYSNALARYRVQRWASPLPAVLDAGAMADLDYLRVRLPNVVNEASWTVWLGPHAPADAVARLTAAGLLVEHVTTARARVAALGRQGPALGLLLLLVCAVAAAILAVGGTAVALLADGRRRSFELAALRVVGVPQRTLRRSAVVEQALLLGSAVVLGLPSGYAAAALVLPVVPEFSDTTPVVLRYGPPIVLAIACVAAFALLLAVTAVVAGRTLARAAVPARLREAMR